MNKRSVRRFVEADYSDSLKGRLDDRNRMIVRTSVQLWTYLNYSGLAHPWHEHPDPVSLLEREKRTALSLMLYLDEQDISLRDFCILSFTALEFEHWGRLTTLLGPRYCWERVGRLRAYVGSRERLTLIVDMLMRFLELQVEKFGRARISKSDVVGWDSQAETNHLETYHRLADRIKQCEHYDVDPVTWLELKFSKCADFFKDKGEPPSLKVITNVNSFEVDFADVKKVKNDPWNDVRTFLDLSPTCEFPDGIIPKGWVPFVNAHTGPKDVTKVYKDGSYFTKSGNRRVGNYHYRANTNYRINCTPENFPKFKKTWRMKSYLVGVPTWEEYSQWAAYPGQWDEEGNSTTGRLKPVNWRRSRGSEE